MLQLKGSGFKEALDTIKLLSLPPGLRRKYLARMGRMAIAQTKKNVKDQKTVSGAPMTPRKKVQLKMSKAEAEGKEVKLTAAENRLMFRKMVRGKFLRVKLSEDSATIAFGRAGNVASKHHYGYKSTYEAYDYPGTFDTSKVQTRLNKEITGDQCTANMAAMLIRLRHLPPHLRNLPGGAAARLRYIMQNITKRQAMFLIKRGKEKISKTTLPYEVPARPILGVSHEQIKTWGNILITSLNERFRAKQHANLLT